MIFKSVLIVADVPTANGRIYPREILGKAVADYKAKWVDQKRALGHTGKETATNPYVKAEHVSHQIIDIGFEENNLVGKYKILDTPCGAILKKVIEVGVPLHAFLCGVGSLEKHGKFDRVTDDFILNYVNISYEIPEEKIQDVPGVDFLLRKVNEEIP